MTMEGDSTIDLSAFPVACPVCGARLAKIDGKHAQLHGMTLKAFKATHGGYTTMLQRSREKVKALYQPDFKRWGMIIRTPSGEARYITKRYYSAEEYADVRAAHVKSANRFPINDTTFARHFSGANPLAIFPHGDKSRFFGFDVDSRELAAEHATAIVETLVREGVPIQNVHVSLSGGKGVHVELFTKRPLDITRWTEFGRYVRAQAGLVGEAIEFRPTLNNSNAFKLPLTLHHKTGNFAAFCDPVTLQPKDILESHDYLFAIEPMDVAVLSGALFRARQFMAQVEAQEVADKAKKDEKARQQRQAVKINDERVFHTTEDKRKAVARALTTGLVQAGTRWQTTRSIVLYLYHESGMPVGEIREVVADWTAQQIEAGKVTTPFEKCMDELDDMLEWVPESSGFHATVRELTITAAEVEWVLGVEKRTARELLFALLLRSKAYAGRKGTFYTAHRSIQAMFHPVPLSRMTITNGVDYLVENGYIEATVPKTTRERMARVATTYRLMVDAPQDSEIIGEVDFSNEMDCRELMRTVAAKICDERRLKNLKLTA